MRDRDPAIAAEAYDWGDRVEIGAGVAVTLVPTQHWSARNLSDRNMSLWASFVIEAPGGRIYCVADSGYGDGRHFRAARERHGPLRLAILPIGAYEPRWFMRSPHMNPAESVQAFIDCGAELALGHHYGTFQLTDEAIDAPLDRACRGAAGCRNSGRALPHVAARTGVGTVIKTSLRAKRSNPVGSRIWIASSRAPRNDGLI